MSSNFQRTFENLVAANDVLNNPPPLQHAPGLTLQLPPPVHPAPASPLSYPRVFEVGKES